MKSFDVFCFVLIFTGRGARSQETDGYRQKHPFGPKMCKLFSERQPAYHLALFSANKLICQTASNLRKIKDRPPDAVLVNNHTRKPRDHCEKINRMIYTRQKRWVCAWDAVKTSSMGRVKTSPNAGHTLAEIAIKKFGCFKFERSMLSSYVKRRKLLTRRWCFTTCRHLEYPFVGVMSGHVCHCGKTFNPDSYALREGECDMPCSGHRLQTCGGTNRVEVMTLKP